MSPESSISVVIPTRNNERTIGVLLHSLLTQSLKPCEVIVVDGQSTDQTPAFATRLGAQLVSYPCTGDMRGFARNLGASLASGEALFFIDSDMELTPNVISECQMALDTGAPRVVIPEVNRGVGLLASVRDWERELVQSVPELTFSRVISRDVFRRCGGFDERILGFEDLDLQLTLDEMGAKTTKIRSPIIHHEETVRLADYIRKRRYYQRTADRFRSKHPRSAALMFSPADRIKLYMKGLRGIRSWALLVIAVFLRCIETL